MHPDVDGLRDHRTDELIVLDAFHSYNKYETVKECKDHRFCSQNNCILQVDGGDESYPISYQMVPANTDAKLRFMKKNYQQRKHMLK